MEEFYDDIDIVLAKYLSGEATPEEAMRVSSWMNHSEENKKTVLKLEQVWGFKKYSDQEKHQVLKSILQNVYSKKEEKTFFMDSYRWAASIALLLISGTVLYFILSDKSDQQNTLTWITKKTNDQLLEHSFQDSSHVVLSKNSRLRYPEKFQTDKRELELAGEAYFRVTPDPTRPFVVKVDELSVKVLGTQFNIKSDSALQIVEVVVTEGKVLFSDQSDSIEINKGWYGIYDQKKKEFNLRPVEEQKANSIAYATGSFEFEKSSFAEIAEQLKKVYSVDIIFDNESIARCNVHGTFKNKSLDFILDVVCAALNVSYTKTGNTVHIQGNGCL